MNRERATSLLTGDRDSVCVCVCVEGRGVYRGVVEVGGW